MTRGCENCPYWKNDENERGCSSPRPIMECEFFVEMMEQENNNG